MITQRRRDAEVSQRRNHDWRRLVAVPGGSTGYGDWSRHAGAVNHAVDFGIAQNNLYIVARFRERDGLHQLRNLFVITFPAPQRDAILTSVKRRERIFRS